MDIFDGTIREIKGWFQRRWDEGEVRHYDADLKERGRLDPKGLAFSRSDSILLKEDTHLELGHPSVGSCAAALATHDASLIDHGRISLAGPEIQELEGDVVPFAQITLACCRGEIKEIFPLMDRQLHRSARLEGYMIRSVPNVIWARVSKQAVKAGFSFHHLGQWLLKSLWQEIEEIMALEILFVTTCRADIVFLDSIMNRARAKLNKILSFEQKADDTYECTTGNDCEECPEQQVCDSIRDVIKLRKGDRIISFGGERGEEMSHDRDRTTK
jgi:CO dehydrogenase/acetyl-CoA synthase beta subunit